MVHFLVNPVEFRFYRSTACNATHVIAKAFLSVRPSVRLTNTWIETKRKKVLSTFLYHMKDHSSLSSDKKSGWWGRPLIPEMLGQIGPVERKRQFSIDIPS